MTRTLARFAQPRPRQLLAWILEDPALVATVQALEPRVLGRLIQHVGLEDSGEIVSLATTEQLERIFDEDLWRSEEPGKDEAFDADRFALWLEVMLEAGEDFTAQKLAELPEDLVTLSLYRHILVVNVDELAVEMEGRGEDNDLTDKALDSCLYYEFGQYQVISKRHDGWDAILSVLVALDRDHHSHLQRILERCCYLSSEFIEENGGLYDVLTSEEMLESDVAAEREEQRAREGFIAPSAAASFLGLARVTDLHDVIDSREADPITRAYFRAFQPTRTGRPRGRKAAPGALDTADKATRLTRLVEQLDEAEVPREARQNLLAGGTAPRSSEADALFKRAVVELHASHPKLHLLRMDELSYLGNVLVAGCSFAGRRLRPFEAVEAVVATCNLGLEHLLKAAPGNVSESPLSQRATDTLAREGADKLFRAGWHLLYTEVSLAAAGALERALAQRIRETVDRDVVAPLASAAKAVSSAIAAGKPWVARRRLDALGLVFDAPTLKTLKALLDECPSISRETGVGPDRPGGRSPREREFIATAEQLRRAQRFLEELCGSPR